ncbi:hypothetical protein SUGI_0570250 [Cryptomeria japonica]|nr:hypothetical protein SUGI_0570250 [Cryptomeria japonica]
MEEVKRELTLKNKPYKASPCIFSASTALLKEYKDAYVPQIVSISPYHFRKEHLRGMQKFKSEAAHRQVVRIQSALSYPQFNFEQVIEKIRWREEDIKRCYDKGTPLRGEVLLWMVSRDACFILEFFRNHLSGLQDDDIFCRYDYVFRPMYHPIFGSQSENPGVQMVVRARVLDVLPNNLKIYKILLNQRSGE